MFMAGSFRKYTDMKNEADEMESGERAANDASQLDIFTHEIELIKEDVKTMEKLSRRLNETNEESRTAQQSAKMRELRSLMESDLEYVLMSARSVIERIQGLGRLSNNNPPAGARSSIDKTRISVVQGLGKKLRELMDEFQGFRVRTVAVYKESIEQRYFSITGGRKFIETIENLVANGEIEDDLSEAMLEHGREWVLDFIAEIHERQQGARNMQRNLVTLHQMFLETTALVESQAQKMANGNHDHGGENQEGRGNSYLKPAGVAQLHDLPVDYDREAKRRATVGLIFAVFLVFMIIIPLFVAESNRDQE